MKHNENKVTTSITKFLQPQRGKLFKIHNEGMGITKIDSHPPNTFEIKSTGPTMVFNNEQESMP